MIYPLNEILYGRENESTTTVCNNTDESQQYNCYTLSKKETDSQIAYSFLKKYTRQYIIQTHIYT